MLKINEELQEKLRGFNSSVCSRYVYSDILSKDLLVKLVGEKIDIIRQIERFDQDEIGRYVGEKGIVGVDGSINTVGSSYPHYFSLLQALAKSTRSGCPNILEADIHSPLVDEDAEAGLPAEGTDDLLRQERDERIRSAKMARLELKAAVRAIGEIKPSVILMDGSLVRYRIYCGTMWEEFRKLALQSGILVAGVIEEIKTNAIARALKGCTPKSMEGMFDREILFGLLEYKEILLLKSWRGEDGIKKCFMRSSKDPHVIGIDMLEEQWDRITDMARLVLSLTPENSRGIPLWLDIVDSEVKIPDRMMKALVETYIDPAARHLLLTAKRDNRTL